MRTRIGAQRPSNDETHMDDDATSKRIREVMQRLSENDQEIVRLSLWSP